MKMSLKMGKLEKIKCIVFLVLFLCFSCSNKTEIKSSTIPDKKERVQKLLKEIKADSEILDAEFDLFNVNGFSDDFVMIPGSSSIDYKFVVKVDPKKISNWTKDLSETSGNIGSEKWTVSLIEKREKEWKTATEPVFYKRKNDPSVVFIIFEKEGIIYKRILRL